VGSCCSHSDDRLGHKERPRVWVLTSDQPQLCPRAVSRSEPRRVLESLLQVTPFQAGWIGLLDPERRERAARPPRLRRPYTRLAHRRPRKRPGTHWTDRPRRRLAGTMRLVSSPGCRTRLRVRLPITPGSGRGREGGKSGEGMQQVDDGDRTAITTGH
jgi:hypothetical protein